jgi:hypothetical protein
VFAYDPEAFAETAGRQAGAALEVAACRRARGGHFDRGQFLEPVLEPRELPDEIVHDRWANRQVAKDRRHRHFSTADLAPKALA